MLREEKRVAAANQRLQEQREKRAPMFHRERKEAMERFALLPQQMRVVQHRWEQLYSCEEHSQLRQAIVKSLAARKKAMDATKNIVLCCSSHRVSHVAISYYHLAA